MLDEIECALKRFAGARVELAPPSPGPSPPSKRKDQPNRSFGIIFCQSVFAAIKLTRDSYSSNKIIIVHNSGDVNRYCNKNFSNPFSRRDQRDRILLRKSCSSPRSLTRIKINKQMPSTLILLHLRYFMGAAHFHWVLAMSV